MYQYAFLQSDFITFLWSLIGYIFILGIIGIVLVLVGPAKHWHTHCMRPKF